MPDRDNAIREEYVGTAEAMMDLGAEWSLVARAGDTVLLDGPLGAGKSTFVRGVLHGLGYGGIVRSPTFNLVQTFATTPPVLHADLYRVGSYSGLGIEDYMESHVCLIEWPDRAAGLLGDGDAWTVRISFDGEGRKVLIVPPSSR